MSAELMVQTGFNQASALAASTSAAAQALVATAVGVLNDYKLTFPSNNGSNPSAAGVGVGGTFNGQEKPPGFPTIREPRFPDDPQLGEIGTISATFTANEPSLSLPTFSYRMPGEMAAFTDLTPVIDGNVTIPAPPSLVFPSKPSLGAVNANLPIDDISVPAFLGVIPTYNNSFDDSFYAAFSAGQARVPATSDALVWINTLFPGLATNYAALAERINGILEGRTTALTDNFDAHSYEQLRSRVEVERAKQLKGLSDSAKGSGWAMPGAARFATERAIDASMSQALNGAALEVFTKRAEWELKHLEFVMELASRIHEMGISFFNKMADHSLEAFKAALAFADTAVKFAHQVYELVQKDFTIKVQLLEAEIKIFETLLKGQLAKIEVVKARLEAEKLKTEVNHELVLLYTAELHAEETKANIYAAQISALESEIKARKFPLDIFLAKVQAYEALSNAKRSEYALIEAEISGDRAKVEGELAKLKVYETQARVYETKVGAESKVVESQATRNQEILALYKTKVEAQMDLVKTDAEQGHYALDSFKAMAEVFLSENAAALQKDKFKFESALETAKFDLEKLKQDYFLKLKELELEMERVKALSGINLSAANVEGSMASSALSAMNAIVSASVAE